MPLIKNITAISYSSQDPKHPLNALLRGTGAWLCSPDDRSGRLSADLQLDRAITISYIDVGNHNSVTLSVEVSRSSSSNGATCALLPTVALMTPQEFRGQHPNCKAVRMFKAEDLDKRALKEQWDRVRVTCCQPFKRGVQFGLSFFKLYTSEVLQPLHLPTSSALVPPSFSAMLPDAAGASASVAASAPYRQVDSDLCTPPSHESMKKTSRGKSMLSDENILQRLENSSPSTFSSNKMMPGFVQGKTTNPQSFSSNVKDKQSKTMPLISTPHAAQMKENSACMTLKNTSSHRSAAQRFRSALDKLCSNQASASPTAVAKQNFLKKFASSTSGSSPSEGGDGRPTPKPTIRTECINVPAGGEAAAGSHQAEFEYEALEFLISLNLQKDQILQLKVADVRVQFEAHRGEPLSRPQRLCFKNLALDYCARRLDTLDFGNQSGPPAAFPRSLPAVEPAAADVSSGRRNGCGISDTSGAGRLGGSSSSSLATSIDVLESKEPNKAKNAPRTESQGKFTFKKLEFESPGNRNHYSPVSGTKQQRFNRAVSKSPMPFYDDEDYPGTRAVSEKSHSSTTRNISKMSPRGGGSAKKRKKEESKPVADGEWVQSKKVRTRVSSSPRNIARKEAYVDDVVEIVELDDAVDDFNERQKINKTPTNSPFQNKGGWLKPLKHKNTALEMNREKSKSISTGATCNGDDTYQPRHSSAHKDRATTTSGSSQCSTDTDSCEPGPSSGSAAVSPDVHGQCVTDDGGPQTGVRLGAVPANKFGLRASLLPQQEEESVECPICSRIFPSSRIEEHAATCDQTDGSKATEAPAAVSSSVDITTAGHEVCPVCYEQLSETDYAQHVLDCADRHFKV